MKLLNLIIVSSGLLAGNAMAQAANMPAARAHVKMVGANGIKYTSKLQQVVELNFTFNFHHKDGKPLITAMLDKIAKDYGEGGKNAFTVKKFTSGTDGSVTGQIVQFTLADLLAGEVIVNNNISNLNELQTKLPAAATAMETAIKTEGRGVLGFHGSGDGGGGWAFYTNDLHPVDYKSHGTRTAGPVYKNDAESKHVILQGILETGTTNIEAPMGVDPVTGNEILKQGVKSRMMMNEWYKFGRNLQTDTKYAPLTRPLLKYDPRNLSTAALDPLYRYKGGNLYTFLLQVGKGKASYIPAGHEADELTLPGTTFDGGTGDYERYYAQTLFYLAGYKQEPCNTTGVVCAGLQVVDAQDHLTGQTYPTSGVLFNEGSMGFTALDNRKWEAKLTDVRGRVVATRSGAGKMEYMFDKSGLGAGIYFLSVKVGSGKAMVKRYSISPR